MKDSEKMEGKCRSVWRKRHPLSWNRRGQPLTRRLIVGHLMEHQRLVYQMTSNATLRISVREMLHYLLDFMDNFAIDRSETTL